MTNDKFFKNEGSRIFSVRFMWHIGQPFVCGTLKEILDYAIQEQKEIEYFVELDTRYTKGRKVSKKELREILDASGLSEYKEKLYYLK